MSLAAKNSRRIVVDDEAYRWAVSPDSGYNVIVVQAANGDGAKFKVYVSYTGIHYASANADGQLAVTPALVTSIIRQGRQRGWDPATNGHDAIADLAADATIVLRATP